MDTKSNKLVVHKGQLATQVASKKISLSTNTTQAILKTRANASTVPTKQQVTAPLLTHYTAPNSQAQTVKNQSIAPVPTNQSISHPNPDHVNLPSKIASTPVETRPKIVPPSVNYKYAPPNQGHVNLSSRIATTTPSTEKHTTSQTIARPLIKYANFPSIQDRANITSTIVTPAPPKKQQAIAAHDHKQEKAADMRSAARSGSPQAGPLAAQNVLHTEDEEASHFRSSGEERVVIPPTIVAAVLNRVEEFEPDWKKDPLGGWVPTPFLVSQAETPIIEVHKSPGTEDIAYGFEGGRAVKDEDGIYWIFTAEMQRAPNNAGMRVAIWRSTGSDPRGKWQRHGTIAESNQSFPLVNFVQKCNDAWCTWKGAKKEHLTYVATYQCDTSDLLASPWAPFPVFDEEEDRWHVFFVGYQCDFTELVACGTGNIFGARSTVPGKRGLGGPYEMWSKGADSIVLGPNATESGKRWGDAHRGSRYVDQMSIFPLGKRRGYAAFTGVNHNMATAPSVHGPWTVGDESLHDVIATPSSSFNENSIASEVTAPTGKTVFGSVFDTVFAESRGMGFAYSKDGVHWGPQKGVDVAVQHGVRTPLGLLEEPDGTYTLFFTRRFQTAKSLCSSITLEVLVLPILRCVPTCMPPLLP